MPVNELKYDKKEFQGQCSFDPNCDGNLTVEEAQRTANDPNSNSSYIQIIDKYVAGNKSSEILEFIDALKKSDRTSANAVVHAYFTKGTSGHFKNTLGSQYPAPYVAGNGKNIIYVWDPHNHESAPHLLVPYEIGTIVAQHVKDIFDRKYAYSFAWNDFYHGHFVFDESTSQTSQFVAALDAGKEPLAPPTIPLETYYSSIKLVMYHTREHLNDWNYKKPVPRSIVGTMEGKTIIPAIPTDEWSFYKGFGTVTASEITYNGRSDFTQYNTPIIKVDDAYYQIIPQFLIRPADNGRFQLPSGEKFDVYLWLSRGKDHETK